MCKPCDAHLVSKVVQVGRLDDACCGIQRLLEHLSDTSNVVHRIEER